MLALFAVISRLNFLLQGYAAISSITSAAFMPDIRNPAFISRRRLKLNFSR